jgi:hypothetical protein
VPGRHLGDDRMLRNGLRMLEWLLTTETWGGHLSVVPPQGWRPGESRPASDQRPTEVAALSNACAAAVGGDDKWLTGVEMSVAWFAGSSRRFRAGRLRTPPQSDRRHLSCIVAKMISATHKINMHPAAARHAGVPVTWASQLTICDQRSVASATASAAATPGASADAASAR